MDFTDAYRITASTSSHRSFAYSSGSTFFSTLHHLPEVDGGGTIVQVRVSTSLQVIRSWNLDFHAVSLSWSRNGSLLLVVGKKEFIVLSVDPSTSRASGSNAQGLVASVVVGMEGLASASWIGDGSQEAVFAFSADEIMANIYNLQRQKVTTVRNPKRSKISSSPISRHVALLTRQTGKDELVILASPNQRYQTDWMVEEKFALHTNDAIEAIWSPCEKYIAIREAILEYKVQVYSPLGHLQCIYQSESDPSQVETKFQTLYKPTKGDVAETAGGGLGIRVVKWSPNSELLALGGYDETVRILESKEWTMMACLDLSQKLVTESHSVEPLGRLQAWREPSDWRRETGGRGIVTFEEMDMPFTVPSLRIDLSSSTSTQSGISWLEWNHDGTLLGICNDNHPTALYIYAFPPPSYSIDDFDHRIQPYLLSIVMLSSAITLASWKPKLGSAATDQIGDTSSTLAIIASQGQAINLWSCREDHTQIVEAVPIPIDDFQAVDFAFAPDGNKMLITSQNDTYCCAIEAQEDSTFMQDSRL